MNSDRSELAQLLVEAEDVARAAGQAMTSAHLLLAAWTTPCAAAILLGERGVGSEEVLAAMDAAPREPEEIVPLILGRTREIAASVAAQATTLHLLIAISRSPDSLAYRLLERCGVPLAPLRNTILSWYTAGTMPRHYFSRSGSAPGVGDPTRSSRGEPPSPLPRSPGAGGWGAAPWRTPAQPDAAALRESPPARGGRAGERLLPRGLRGSPPAAAEWPVDPADAAGEGAVPARHVFPEADLPPSSPADRGPDAHPGSPGADAEVRLDPKLFPLLCAFGRNLTEAAAKNQLDPVIGRDREVDEVADILGKRRGNNPVLVGEAGVGKTAIVEGVAQRLLETERQPRIVVELDMPSLTAGTALRGSFSERLGGIKEEVRQAAGRILVFVDELHTVVGAGSTGEGPQDAANELKTALARGEFPCIGATTVDEYRRFIEADPALERRFTPVQVDEPSPEQAAEILRGIAPRYEQHHGVKYEPSALRAAATLTARYVRDRQLPDKAIQAIDLAGSRCRRAGKAVVDVRAVAEVVARAANVPVERLVTDDAERLLRLEEELSARVVGHAEAIARIAATLRRNYAGFSSHRPMGSFLFLGPTGVGKTELAKAMADILFGTPEALLRFDMSEFAEPHGVARLIGAPPGYVGHGDGGQLTEAVRRRPASVVLLDEIEKAHRDVQLLLLQILDEGRLTDAKGRAVDFSHSMVVLTSNLGAEAFAVGRGATPVGFGAADRAERTEARSDRALELARGQLPIELWNRIDERCVFAPLGKEEVGQIARLLLADSAKRLAAERRIELRVADDVVSHLVENGGYDVTLGARPMRQLIQRSLETPLADAILRGEVSSGDSVEAVLDDGAIVFTRRVA
ncbi:MAG TPA: ATP-dependent Clp protease ATP-binding subunit [Vulgatibacter sp.]|nr:ATP-dependent Clp protease ATP-binding subunit [Vulgatibacter sp.]